MNDVSATEGTYPPPHNNDAADEAPNLALTDVVKEDATLGESTDPLRLYLKKLGSTTLLSRDGEVAIAKRIEDAENAVLTACSTARSRCARSSSSGPPSRQGRSVSPTWSSTPTTPSSPSTRIRRRTAS
jgi:hypothetical protein